MGRHADRAADLSLHPEEQCWEGARQALHIQHTHRFLLSMPDDGRETAELFSPVKLSPDLEESTADSEPKSPDMLRPCEPVLLALRGLECRL